MKLKKSYRPRLRVRANSDSKKKVKKLKLIKNYKKKVNACKNISVQNCLLEQKCLCPKLSSCKIIFVYFFTLVQI